MHTQSCMLLHDNWNCLKSFYSSIKQGVMNMERDERGVMSTGRDERGVVITGRDEYGV